MSLGTTSRLSGNQLEDDGVSCMYPAQSAFLRLMWVLCRAGDEVAVVPMVVCVCHSDEVMREADANDTSGTGVGIPREPCGRICI